MTVKAILDEITCSCNDRSAAHHFLQGNDLRVSLAAVADNVNSLCSQIIAKARTKEEHPEANLLESL